MKPGYAYESLDGAPLEDAGERLRPRRDSCFSRQAVAAVLCVLLGFGVGIVSAMWYVQAAASRVVDTQELLYGNATRFQPTPFEYDDRYPGPPTEESEQLWLDLLPDGLGFVQHEQFGPGIVDLAVFHQLHCLMAIRHSLYDSWNETQHSHMTPHHMRHCLEYIRQSIMCNGDTNIEHRITFENGEKFTPGWGLHQCRDYGSLKRFAEEWRVWDGKTPRDRRPITDPDAIKGRKIFY